MNIEIHFLKKAIENRNYINFIYEKQVFTHIQVFHIKESQLLTNQHSFDIKKIKKLTLLKEQF